MMRIREMRSGDIPEVMLIEKESFNDPWAEIHFYSELYLPVAITWVAVSAGKIAGYLCCWKIEDELHLNNIAVRRDVRRKGVAQKMMNKLIRLARDEGKRIITLEVSDRNPAAIAFYEKNGFLREGFRPNYYEHDHANALILTKHMETT